MINFKVALLSLVMSTGAFAQSDAAQLFKNSPEVKAEIEKIKSNSITELEEGAIYTVPVNGGCGVAGCDETVLVIQVLEYNGTNAHFTSVKGIVDIPALGTPSVKVVEIKEKN